MSKAKLTIARVAGIIARRTWIELTRFEAREHNTRLVALYREMEADEDRKPTAQEILEAVQESREGDAQIEKMRWDLLAAAKAMGATTRQIKAASGAGQATIDRRFSVIRLARAKDENVVTLPDGRIALHFSATGS